MLYLGGQYANIFGRGALSSSTLNANTALSKLCDDYVDEIFRFTNADAADPYLSVNQNLLLDPGFETLADWEDADLGSGASTLTTTAGEFRSGLGALKLVGSDASNYAARRQTITVRAAEKRRVRAFIKTPSSGTLRIYVFNLDTQKWLAVGGAWQTSQTYALEQAATGSFAEAKVSYTTEAYSLVQDFTCRVRVMFYCQSGTVFVDDGDDVASVNFGAIFGHNCKGQIAPKLQSSDDGSSWTDRATATVRRREFFVSFDAVEAQHWRWRFYGSNDPVIYVGEAVAGYAKTPGRAPLWGFKGTHAFPSAAHVSDAFRRSVRRLTEHEVGSIELEFRQGSQADFDEWYHELWAASRAGEYPTVLVPIDSEAAVYHGRLAASTEPLREWLTSRRGTLTLLPSPGPTVGLDS